MPQIMMAIADESARQTAARTRDGVELTNLDSPLFDGAEATKRDLVEYLDFVSARLVPVLADRPLIGHQGPAGAGPFHAEERAQVRP